jgi:hypothetical protein
MPQSGASRTGSRAPVGRGIERQIDDPERCNLESKARPERELTDCAAFLVDAKLNIPQARLDIPPSALNIAKQSSRREGA